jgi:hypothetical protein
MLKDRKVVYDEPIAILCDNSSAINIYKNMVLHSKTKNISIKFHILREKVNEKEVRLEYVYTKKHIANMFMKPFPKDNFEYLRGNLGVISPPN